MIYVSVFLHFFQKKLGTMVPMSYFGFQSYFGSKYLNFHEHYVYCVPCENAIYIGNSCAQVHYIWLIFLSDVIGDQNLGRIHLLKSYILFLQFQVSYIFDTHDWLIQTVVQVVVTSWNVCAKCMYEIENLPFEWNGFQIKGFQKLKILCQFAAMQRLPMSIRYINTSTI